MINKENLDWLNKSTALMRLSLAELQNLIIALVIAENSARTLSIFDYSKPFEILRKDIIKVKDNLIREREKYEENQNNKMES